MCVCLVVVVRGLLKVVQASANLPLIRSILQTLTLNQLQPSNGSQYYKIIL